MSPSEKIQFKCPTCGKGFSTSHKFAGKRGKCPGCGQTITIPTIEELSVESLRLSSVEQPHNEQKETEPEIKMPPPAKTTVSGGNIFRAGNIMVMQRGAILPNRCIKTNDTEELRFKKINLRWHHPALYFTIFAGLLVYIIVALICTKKATIDVSVSRRILTRRLIFVLVTWVCAFAGIFAFIYGIIASGSISNTDNLGLIFMLSVLMFIVAAIVYLIGGRFITASKIDDYYVWIKGVNPEYLGEFPQWQFGFVGAPIASKKCTQCGNNVSATDQFCWRCGVNL